ncbi:uncharacterized protein MONOS_14013 [Monocercomonoides exilis]|uniref:uncharacterized protein n=1 Tax=Monocercomonoides exilis TaxID=2049356 RepID=UPI003559E5B3|nr:hypothetical protein MONOS_14013 [Monocercomonoides exilis]|eukprot:MONOS_14013.1-p1 / transcript=MONOS_14013.1 / gene=MONOS_14013 / organism=Monocercomonoides_exilis_PA203 / gene_product=unspecified product / transcript_product=unspecified product / location=Mono_scaffold00921:10343-10777(+) / protein_length=144 / sequence_SO=supercontig / SO=protein_coding / is_pseudo=false
MDGSVGHFDEEFKRLCRGNLIDMIKLPSHTSHILQPNDQFVFANMKKIFTKAKECGKTTSSSSKREAFVSILRNGLSSAGYPETIVASWKVSGRCPVDRSLIMKQLQENPPEWAESEVQPARAPEGSTFRAIYRASDRLLTLLK